MPPRPLSCLSKRGTATFTPDALVERADHALLAMRVISIWSMTDHTFSVMASMFLRADFEVVNEMLQALTSSEGRRAAIAAAARASLTEDDLNLYRAVLKVTKPSRERRNDFAHHIWGYLTRPHDVVLLADPKAISAYNASTQAKQVGLKPRAAKALDISKILVFRIKDLEEEVAAAKLAQRLVTQFSKAISGEHSATQARTALSSHSAIQQALQAPSSGSAPTIPRKRRT